MQNYLDQNDGGEKIKEALQNAVPKYFLASRSYAQYRVPDVASGPEEALDRTRFPDYRAQWSNIRGPLVCFSLVHCTTNCLVAGRFRKRTEERHTGGGKKGLLRAARQERVLRAALQRLFFSGSTCCTTAKTAFFFGFYVRYCTTTATVRAALH